jgi:hypothetical protein
MFSHLLLLVTIASPASFRVVQNGFQASEPGLRPGQEDDAPTSNSASPAPNGALGKDQATNDNNEISTTLGDTVATLSNNAGGRPVAFALLSHLVQSSDASVANAAKAAKAILVQETEEELVAAVFTTLYDLAGSNNATLETVANDALRLIEGMNDINEITTTLGNLVASNNAIIDQGTPGAQSAAVALFNKLARSNDSSVANAAIASAARYILIKATKSEEEMVAAVFTTLNDVAAMQRCSGAVQRCNNTALAAVANEGLRLIEGMNDMNEIATTLGNAFAFGNAIAVNNSSANAAVLTLLGQQAQSNDTSVAYADAARAILFKARQGRQEMVAAVFFTLNDLAGSNNPTLVTVANNGFRLLEGMDGINEIATTLGNAFTVRGAKPAAQAAVLALLDHRAQSNNTNDIFTTLGNAVAFGNAIADQGNNSSADAATLALLNNLAQSNDTSVANAARAILIKARKSQEEMVAAVFSTLKDAARSNSATLSAVAKDGLRLVEGMNAINEIVTTLGNAVAFGNAIATQGNNSGAHEETLALLNHLCQSNNVSVANAARAILFKARQGQEEMVAAVFTTLNELAGSNNATLAAVAKDGLRVIEGMDDMNEIATTLGYSFALGNAKPTAHAAALSLLNNLCQSNGASVANAARAILIQATKGQEDMVHVVTFAGAPHAVAYTPFGVTHSSNVGICTNVDGAVVPCHRKTLP